MFRGKKRILSLLSSAAMAVTALTSAMTGAMTVSAYTMDDVFTYKYLPAKSEYKASLSTNYADILTELGTTDIVMSDVYNDGTNDEHPVGSADMYLMEDENTITSITYSSNIKSLGMMGDFASYKALKTLTIPYSGLNFAIPAQFAYQSSSTYAQSLEDIYIYAQSVTLKANSFQGINETVTIHVASEDVKNTIVSTTASGSSPVSEERIEVMQATLPVPEVTLTCEDIYYGTEGGFKPSATVKVNNEPVEDAQVTFKIYGDEECNNEKSFPNGGYKSSSIPVDTYYFRAIVAASDTYMSALSNVVEVKVLPNVVSEEAKTALNEAIQAAKEFQSSHQKNNYDTVEWENIFGRTSSSGSHDHTGLLYNAELMASNIDNGTYTDEKVKAAAEELKNAVNALQPKRDFTKLDELIAQAEDIIDNHADEYWDTSISALQTALNNAKKLKEDPEAAQARIDGAAETLQRALDKLEKIDAEAEFAALQQAIKSAEALDQYDYTEDSYAALPELIEAGKAITENSTPQEMRAARTAITNAVNKLVSKPLETIAYVYRNGKVANILNGIAGEALAGAKKIKLTFDCASDVDFNSNATIEVNALVDGEESYQRINGNKGQASGETCEVTLELKNAIEAGNEFDITAFTYAWTNAKDYVYAITKVEFLDKDGNLLGMATARSIAKDNLAKAIADAEAIDADKYTAASYEELAKAIEAAKELEEGATATEMNAAIDAIKAAVKALAEKPAPTEPTEPTKPSQITNPTTKTPTTTKTPAKTTRSAVDVKKDKTAAQKLMKQAKITKLTAKSKAKKKVAVSWKKVKKAKGYQVQVSAKKNFKKVIFKKFTSKNKLTIKNSKIKSKKTYYVRVRAYATYKDKNGKAQKVYSKWNKKIRKVKVK